MAEVDFRNNPCPSCGKRHVVFPGGLGRCKESQK
jgi:hypothetical protein